MWNWKAYATQRDRVYQRGSNRTIVELKEVYHKGTEYRRHGSNRTIVELKFDKKL